MGKQVGSDMHVVSHFNPLWSRKQSRTGSLYTMESYHVRMPVDKGAVGRALKSGESQFIQNVQKLDKNLFLRHNSAKKHNIKSVLFMPETDGGEKTLIEVGSRQVLSLVSGKSADNVSKCLFGNTPADALKLFQIVDDGAYTAKNSVDLSMYCNQGLFIYAIAWIRASGEWQAVQHYNPQKRIEEVLEKTGHVEMYTTESYAFRMKNGVGMIGNVQKIDGALFLPNVQRLDPQGFLRLEIAHKFGINSVVFLEFKGLIIEIGTTTELTLAPTATAKALETALQAGVAEEVMAMFQGKLKEVGM